MLQGVDKTPFILYIGIVLNKEPMNYTIDRQVHNQLKELIEDSVEYFCDDNMVSGELAWIIVDALAQAKIAQMKGECV